jgi:hypothetical protein
LWLKFVILLENTVPNNMVKGTFWKKFKKIITFQESKLPNHQDFLRIWADF